MKKLATLTAALMTALILTNNFESSAQIGNENSSIPLIRLQGVSTKAGSHPDETVIYFHPGATLNYDYEFDGKKLLNTDPTLPNIYSVTPQNDSLVFNCLPDTLSEIVVPLYLDVVREGSFKIIASEISNFNENVEISIEDSQEKKIQNFSTSNEYTFTLKPNEKHRFFIHFKRVNKVEDPNIYASTNNFFQPNNTETTTGTKNIAKANKGFTVSSTNNDITVNFNNNDNTTAKLSIYDISGKRLITTEISSGSNQIKLNTLKFGTYIVRIESLNSLYVKKVHLG